MRHNNYRENYIPTIDNRLREMRRAKVKAWAFSLACAAGFIATALDLFFWRA